MASREIDIKEAVVTIKIFGIGGGGNKVLARLDENKLFNSERIAINTDSRQLQEVEPKGIKTLLIGENITNGLGTGGKIEIAEKAALDAEERIRGAMHGADMVFVMATMGGGVGTGAAPVVARIAREMGVLSVGIVTEPFPFEGNRKIRIAKVGIEKMQAEMDALLIVKNENLLKLQDKKSMNMRNAFVIADDTLRQAISCIVEIIQTTGVINVDFADAVTIFRQGDSSDAVLGNGEADTALEAVKSAINNPLLDKSIEGARGVIVNITSGVGLPMMDVGEATQYIFDCTHADVNTILGIVQDSSMGTRVRATVIATDFVNSVSKRSMGTGFGTIKPVNPINSFTNTNFVRQGIQPQNTIKPASVGEAPKVEKPVDDSLRDLHLPGFMNMKK